MLAPRNGPAIGFGVVSAAGGTDGASGAADECGRAACGTLGGESSSGALTVPRVNEFANETSRLPVEASEEEGNSDTANLIESPIPVSGMKRREVGNEWQEPTARRPVIVENAKSAALPTEILDDSSRSCAISAE